MGVSTAQVSLSNLSFKMVNDTLPTLKMKFNRTGNMSVYGDITINYISPAGEKTQVGLAKGIAVYTPNAVRWSQINLDKNFKYNTGKLHVVYSIQTGGKLAETELLLH